MAKFNLPVPKELAELKRDERGYPTPFFVGINKAGQHDFRLLSAIKQARCVKEKLCAICGKKLPKDYCYFISGILGMSNQISSDPAMHRVCAEFSLAACPHMKYQRADRRDTGIELNELTAPLLDLDKPKHLFLIKAKVNFWMDLREAQPLIRYTKVSHEKYEYVNGILERAGDNDITGLEADARARATINIIRGDNKRGNF